MMNRELSMEFVRVTEAAAIASARGVGRGDKNGIDQLAVDAMRKMFDTVNISGTVVIGEGEMDEAPMLYIGEHVGAGGPEVDIAVDPVEGTNLVAKGQPGAIAVIAIAPKGCLLHAPDMYMDKIAVGPRAKGCINIDDPVSANLERVAKALNRGVGDLTVVALDRPRHRKIIEEVRAAGARIRLISDGRRSNYQCRNRRNWYPYVHRSRRCPGRCSCCSWAQMLGWRYAGPPLPGK